MVPHADKLVQKYQTQKVYNRNLKVHQPNATLFEK